MNLISKRFGSIIKDNTSLRLTLTEELIQLGITPEDRVIVSLIEKNNEKKVIIQKI